jgi:[protein-PII] uridylyltransferase
MTIVGNPVSNFSHPEAVPLRPEADLDALRHRFLATGDANGVLQATTSRVDQIVVTAFEQYLRPAYPLGLAILAVGGYGRRELFPHSDIDLLLLEESPPDSGGKEAISRFMQSIWDANLRLSHSVHSVRECVELHEQNIELNISLLDRRLLAGDEKLWLDLEARTPKFLATHGKTLSRHLCRITRQRHSKFHDTIFHLEPNIKEGPGGLRDLHCLQWLHKLRPEDAQSPWKYTIEAARDLLFRVRCFLHYRANRDNNLLSFDAQEEYACLDFVSGVDCTNDPKAAAHWMRDYFHDVRAISRETLRTLEAHEGEGSSLLAGFRDWRTRLSNSDFTVSRERVLFRAPNSIDQDPALVLRLFEFVGRHGIPLHRESEKRIEQTRQAIGAYLATAGEALWPALSEIFSAPHCTVALRAMHQSGVLSQVFPEFGNIECAVIRDFNHRYTVDEHTIIAIENADELSTTTDPARRRFAQLLSELPNTSALRLGLLFHDTGKGGDGDEGHCVTGAANARAALTRVGAPSDLTAMVEFLVLHHLDLSGVMLGRDLDDPLTAEYLAHQVGTVERLRGLTLLTYSDISAVHPTALSPWRIEQLWRVYSMCYRELTRELDAERIVLPEWSSTDHEAFLKGLPTRYLRTHTPERIQEHLQLEQTRRQTGVAISIQRMGGVWGLSLLTKDRLSLFASVAGTLSSFNLNILKAEAFANQQGTVLDTFVFEDPRRNLDLNPPEVDRLRATLERVILGRTSVKDLLRNRPKPALPSKASRIEPRVNFDNSASSGSTLVEVTAQDRPGLLFDLANAFTASGCSIDVVLVDTEAHKAIDVFYVTRQGVKLQGELIGTLRDAILDACGR